MIDLRIAAPGTLRVEETDPVRERPGPGEVLVAVERVTLCGSDYRLFQGTYGTLCSYPVRFGHEWSGRVAAAGAGTRLAVGTRVTGDCSRWCGACDLCGVDRNLCRHIEKFGITRDGFSTGMRRVEEKYLYADEYGIGYDALALVEPFAVAWRGVRSAGPVDGGTRALVIGAGPLGIATLLVLERAHGVDAVEVVEVDAERRDFVADRLGGLRLAEELAPSPEELRSYADLQRYGRYPVVFECSGSEAGLQCALAMCAPAGRVVAYGLGGSPRISAPALVGKGLTLAGSIGGTGSFPEAMALLHAHRDLPERMLTHRLSAREAATALGPGASDRRRIKVQLSFQGV